MLMGGDVKVAETAEPAQPVREAATFISRWIPAFVVNYTHKAARRYMQVSAVLKWARCEGDG